MAVAVTAAPLKDFAEFVAGDDASVATVLWQLGVAAGAALLGHLIARTVCRRVKPGPSWKFGEGDFERVAYPLFTYLLLVCGKLVLRRYQAVPVLEIAQSLLVAWIVIRIAVYVLGHVLPPGGFLRGSIRTIAWVAWAAVALHITGLLPGVIATLDGIGLSLGTDRERITLWLVMQAVTALALTLALAAWVSRITATRVMAAQHMEMSTRVVVSKVVHAGAIFIAILVALPLVGIPITALSIFSGALGVGLGFGLQKIASNYVSGFIVLLDRSLRIGDIITVDNRKGEVRAIESRYTVIKGGDGTESIIPNEKLIIESVKHHTVTHAHISTTLAFVADFAAEPEQVIALLLQAAHAREDMLRDPGPTARVKQLREHGVEYELVCWLAMGRSEAQLRSDLFIAVLKAFRETGIQIPYPRSEIRLLATPAMGDGPKESKA